MQSDSRERQYVNEKNISKYLKCTLCLLVFKNPQRLKCGQQFDQISHTFCKECILNWLKIKAQCPLCKQQIKEKKIESMIFVNQIADLVAAGLISELSVFCRNREYGCKWNGELDRLENHENKCTAKEVAEKLKLQKSGTHQNESDDDSNINDPGNLWFRVTAKLDDKEQLLNSLGQKQQEEVPVEDSDPLAFLESLNQYLGNPKKESNVVGIDFPKQQRDRVQ